MRCACRPRDCSPVPSTTPRARWSGHGNSLARLERELEGGGAARRALVVLPFGQRADHRAVEDTARLRLDDLDARHGAVRIDDEARTHHSFVPPGLDGLAREIGLDAGDDAHRGCGHGAARWPDTDARGKGLRPPPPAP